MPEVSTESEVITKERIMGWSETGLRYQEELEDVISQKDILVFPSNGPEKCAIVMSNLFKHTQDEILIFSKSFSGSYSNHPDYIDSLDEYLTKGRKISLLLENVPDVTDPSKVSAAYFKIWSYLVSNKDKGEIRKITRSGIEKLSARFKNNSLHHFSVADKDKYLLEIDSDTKEALSSFHHPKVAQSLKEAFKEVFEISDATNISTRPQIK